MTDNGAHLPGARVETERSYAERRARSRRGALQTLAAAVADITARQYLIGCFHPEFGSGGSQDAATSMGFI